ncbi:MAG: VWA domain-containing protein, partial [Chlorobiaceae bacterium]|nr:VWA domain-containing protein [Chlorobiaceae bacterium]
HEAVVVLAKQLTQADRVSVVAVARTARLWVDGLQGGDPEELVRQVGNLNPEGGTNLELALDLAYETAAKHFLTGGNNRVVLLTDGAANLGNVDPAALKQKVGSQGAAGGTGQGSGSGRGGMGSGFGNGGIADPYKAQLAMIITRNWEFSKAMTRSSAGMEVYVRIDILPDGTIREIVYDRRAPSEYLNMSVKRALEKSSPFPALPKDKGNPDLWVGFVFTPEGIER